MSELKDWSSCSVGFELTPKSVVGVAVEPGGAVFDSAVFERGSGLSAVERLTSAIESVASASAGVETVGVAVPGLIDRPSGRVAHSTMFDFENGMGLAETLSGKTGVRVVLENDANAAAIAEFKAGAGRGADSLFFVTLGEGIGGALIFNGSIWRGDSGFAGEFGNIAINSEGMRLEDIASAANVVRRTRNRFHQDSTSSLSRLAEEEIKIDAIVEAARNEDDFALMMLERTGTYVGTAVATVINLLNIERIVIGGEIMEAGDPVLQAIIRRARELAFAPAFKNTTIVSGELGVKAAAIGAAISLDQ